MQEVRNSFLLTDVHSSLLEFVPEDGSAFVFGTTAEERSAHLPEWEDAATNVSFVRVTDQLQSHMVADVDGASQRVALRGTRQLASFWSTVSRDSVYLDITGLSHHVWAPLLKTALECCRTVRVVYVEPDRYRFSANPKESGLFDLSEAIGGIRPINGFTVLDEEGDTPPCFVPLLGFEGARFAHLLEQIDPPGDRIIPVVGIPGFRIEFPFHTFHGNQAALLNGSSWRNVRYAIANDPFSIFYLLDEIAQAFPFAPMKVAMIGTKPHALGAVLYALARKRGVELVYDHPNRKDKRTVGSQRALVYHVSKFLR